jgi:hypothetical protein
MVEVDLEGAVLADAILRKAVLVRADLRKASLQGADLRQACLTGAKLTDAVYDDRTRWPTGFSPRRHGAKKVPALRPAYPRDHP